MPKEPPAKLPKRAMVMAAGLGKRMRPLTDDRPKPLVRVAGKALIDHVLDRLAAAGVEEAVVNVHYMADMLEAHLAAREGAPQVTVSDERALLLDTGGGLRHAHAQGLLGEGAILYVNSDTVWTNGFADTLHRLGEAWDRQTMDALMLLAPLVNTTGYDGLGDFEMDRLSRLRRREEKRVAPFAWMGVQIIDLKLLEGMPEGPFSTNRLWDKAIEAGRLYGIRHDGLWMHVGSVEGLREAEYALGTL
jgi:MurNAc alpha-1-phosphate uridylyltransferase